MGSPRSDVALGGDAQREHGGRGRASEPSPFTWRRLGPALTACGVLLALLVHFGVTLLYLTPLNALKAKWLDQVAWYMNPYFSQTWELFGPNPTGRSKTILVSCQLSRGAQSEPEWFDITTPLMRLHHADRLSSAQRLLRAENPSYQLFPSEDPVLATLLKLPQEDPAVLAAVRDLERGRQEDFEVGLRVFSRVASGYCDAQHGTGETTSVRGRVVFNEPQEFRNRQHSEPASPPQVYETEWLKHEPVERYH